MWPAKRQRDELKEIEQYHTQRQSCRSHQNLAQNATITRFHSPRRLLPSLSTNRESFPPPERIPRPYGAYVIASQLVREPVSIGSTTLSANDRVNYKYYIESKESESGARQSSLFSSKECNNFIHKNRKQELEATFTENVNKENWSDKIVTENDLNCKYDTTFKSNNKNMSVTSSIDSSNNKNNNMEDSIAFGATRISSAKRSAATLSSNGLKRSWRKGDYNNKTGSTNNSTNKKKKEVISDCNNMYNQENDDEKNDNHYNINNNIDTSYLTPDESCSVAAVINNGSSEVGVALCTFPALHIGVAQFGDSCTFSKTLTLLYTHNPVEVIVPDTTVEEKFTQTLLRTFQNEMTFTSVQRRFFNSEAGVRTLRELHSVLTKPSQVSHRVLEKNNEYCSRNEHATLFTPCSVNFEETDKYLCVAAAHALIKYLEYINDFKLLPHSLCVKQIMLEHFAEIPRSSARALHIIPPAIGMANAGLVHNIYSDISSNTLSWSTEGSELQLQQYHTSVQNHKTYTYNGNNSDLYSLGGHNASFLNTTNAYTTLTEALPRCATFMGQRFMRSSLLQPLREHSAIHARQDVVEWLLTDFRRALQLRGSLHRLHGLDVERLMALFAQGQNVHNDGKRRLLIQSLLDFWQACEAVLELQFTLNLLLSENVTVETSNIMEHNSKVENNKTYLQINNINNMILNSSTTCKNNVNRELSAIFQQRANLVSNSSNTVSPSRDEEEFMDGNSSSHHHLRYDDIEGCTKCKSKQSEKQVPSLLGHIIHTLHTCQLDELIAELDRYLDSSVRYVLSNETIAPARQPKRQRNARKSEYKNNNNNKDYHSFSSAPETKEQRYSLSSPVNTTKPLMVGAKRNRNNDKRSVYYILRLCFAVKATVGSTLDAARNGFSTQLSHITEYHSNVQHEYQLSSLRLEADPIKLYTFSYSAAEEKKTRFGPFKYKYSWGDNSIMNECNSSAFAEYQRACNKNNNLNSNTNNKRDNVYREDSSSSTSSSLSWCNSPNALHSKSKPHITPGSYTIQRQSLQALHKRRVYCTTDTLDVLCAEARQFSTLILSESVRAVEPLLLTLRGALGSLQAITEAIALLDMLLSFAFYSIAKQCVRPSFLRNDYNNNNDTKTVKMKEGASKPIEENDNCNNESFCYDVFNLNNVHHDQELEHQKSKSVDCDTKEMVYIQDARHPSQLLNNSYCTFSNNNDWCRSGRGVYSAGCVPNTIMWCKSIDANENKEIEKEKENKESNEDVNTKVQPCRILIITGPNTSGKTTLLRMTGQLFALAQSGCFIPCTSAQLFIADRIVAHMLCDELPNVMQSSFKRELVELMEISHTITHNSLVLMDELGRSCSSTYGFALAWATGCFLHNRQSYALCTSHFVGLTSLSRVLPSVANVHFASNVIAKEKNSNLTNTNKINTTSIASQNYNIRMNENNNSKSLNCEQGTSSMLWTEENTNNEKNTRTVKTKLTRTSFLWITHQLLPGKCTAHQYGLALAAQIGLPEHILVEANRLLHNAELKHTIPITSIDEENVNFDVNEEVSMGDDKDDDNDVI